MGGETMANRYSSASNPASAGWKARAAKTKSFRYSCTAANPPQTGERSLSWRRDGGPITMK
jgi:hypothetical protein